MIKLMRRIVVLWCLYGLVRLCILLNPFIFKAATIIAPGGFDEGMPYDVADVRQILGVWFVFVIALLLLCGISYSLHQFTKKLFGEK